MVHIHLWAVLVAFVIAQTPPGFTPSCSGNLGVTFLDGVSVRAGSLFLGSGMSFFLMTVLLRFIQVSIEY